MTESQTKKDFINLMWVILSAVLHATSLVTFSMAAHLYPGGYAGICRILVDFLRDYFGLIIPFAAPYVALNAITLVFVFTKIGKRFSILSLIHIILVSVFTLFFKPLPLDVSDPLLMAVFGGIMNGFAISLALT
ncbi:MAG: YitT family protein, partial [Erysipelotrichaceae bacterium]|nr:YitT family protein [Erysipelotrichaceae bacterium]